MSKLPVFLGVVAAIITLVKFFTDYDSIQNVDISDDTLEFITVFLITFIKTPIIYICNIISGMLSIFTIPIDIIRYFFFDVSKVLESTSAMWYWTWNTTTIDWYWSKSVGWQVVTSFIAWSYISSIWNNSKS